MDRQVAKIGSHAVQKFVRRDPVRRFVAVGCHFDVIDWLQPDWTFEPASMAFTWRSLQRRPGIELEIRRAPYGLWSMFAPYHYMSASLHRSATCFAAYVDDRPVAFAAVLPMPVSNGPERGTAIYRISRIVTLPDWQGCGVAFALSDALGAAYAAIGHRFRNYPAHPAYVQSCKRSPVWRLLKDAGVMSQLSNSSSMASRLGGRPCAIFEYSGAPLEERAARRLIARG